MEQLSQEEILALKELAKNLIAMNRLQRVLKAVLLWGAAIVGSGYLIWDKLISKIGHQ